MRKTLSIILVFTAFYANSQSWIDLGLKAAWGPNLLVNQNVFNDKRFNNVFSFGHGFGAKLGWNFNDFHEITFDFMYSKFTQNFRYNVKDTVTNAEPEYKKSFQYTTLDFALLYRHNSDGRYMEIGPQYSVINSASGTNDIANPNEVDIKENFISGYTSILFGFGSYFLGTENFGLTIGARFTYSLNDIISNKGKTSHYPANTPWEGYKQSHPLTAVLVMEMNFDFAYMAKAKCSNKRKLILF